MEPYERVDAWQRCHELVLAVYRVTATFPRPELYGLVGLRLSCDMGYLSEQDVTSLQDLHRSAVR